MPAYSGGRRLQAGCEPGAGHVAPQRAAACRLGGHGRRPGERETGTRHVRLGHVGHEFVCRGTSNSNHRPCKSRAAHKATQQRAGFGAFGGCCSIGEACLTYSAYVCVCVCFCACACLSVCLYVCVSVCVSHHERSRSIRGDPIRFDSRSIRDRCNALGSSIRGRLGVDPGSIRAGFAVASRTAWRGCHTQEAAAYTEMLPHGGSGTQHLLRTALRASTPRVDEPEFERPQVRIIDTSEPPVAAHGRAGPGVGW